MADPARQKQYSPDNAAVDDSQHLHQELQFQGDSFEGVAGEGSPFTAPHRYHSEYSYNNLRASSTLRHVRQAALTSKKVIWDSNDTAIDAAQSAVDQWEEAYNALRTILVASTQSAKKLYGAAKTGAHGLEHGILLPIRNFILLPAFDAVETTVGFLQSEHAHQLALQSLQLAERVPLVGSSVLAPAMVVSVQSFQTICHIAQYPIPSRHQVRNSVDFVLTGTKWTLTTAGREFLLYIKRADAIITRTLSHTRWKVLGSGPYATLDKLNKQEVIDHLCERYFSLKSTIARYELAAHIRAHNLPLYLDLVLTGLLRKRGGSLTKDDEWLSSCPSYRKHAIGPFLLPNHDFNNESSQRELSELTEKESALWFRLPYVNGKRPGRDAPWLRFNGPDRMNLENRYLRVFQEGKRIHENNSTNVVTNTPSDEATLGNGLDHPSTSTNVAAEPAQASNSGEYPNDEYQNDDLGLTSGFTTVAQWHVPDVDRDVMVDQKRQSVAFFSCCPRCRGKQPSRAPMNFGNICQECSDSQAVVTNHWKASSILSPPPLSMTMRPNLWRFHGPGDEVRRAVWFLDTRRHGLQPYGEEAQAVLEDAYHFLKWRNDFLKEDCAKAKEKHRQPVIESKCPEPGGYIDDDPIGESALLTVQVESPDGGEQQFVQFSSLTAATAIKRGLGGAITLFKRRVYRGADLSHPEDFTFVSPETVFSDDVNLKRQQEHAPKISASGDHRNHLEDEEKDWTILPPTNASLAVPAAQFDDVDRAPRDRDITNKSDDDIDHLVLIVHGIGEMLQSVDLFGLPIPNLASIVDCAGFLRDNHKEIQSTRFSQLYKTSESTSTASTGRTEYLPIEWHEAFSIASQRRDVVVGIDSTTPGTPAQEQLVNVSGRRSQVMMQDITLKTIQNMRDFANNTLFDVLYFMSQEHHNIIVDIVTAELNVVTRKFRALTGFDGRVSVIGHSLGSIILYDILANQKPNRSMPLMEGWQDVGGGGDRMPKKSNRDTSYEDSDAVEGSEWKCPRLIFDVDNAFMLGSPIAVFLFVRNQREPLSETYSLEGCSRVFNIFHPYDPVAYRIEPLLDPRNAEFEPRIMPHWNGGFRVQYQTKLFWRKLVQTTMQTQQNVIERLEAAAMGLLDSTGDGHEEGNQSPPENTMNDNSSNTRIVTGKLNQGRRIDYMLQEKEIEAANEYVAAFAAHSCYWQERDLSLFIARQIYLSRLAHEQAMHFEDLIALDEV